MKLGITPCKYGVLGSWFKEIAKVGIFASDGSVEVTHSGVEMVRESYNYHKYELVTFCSNKSLFTCFIVSNVGPRY